jgi:hypothetical protein
MEPTQTPLKVFVGEFEVVQISGRSITVHLGNNVHATIHLPLDHEVKTGDKLPFFTELMYAYPERTSVQ